MRRIDNNEQWDELVLRNGGHPLQLWGWGRVKELHGPWTAHRLWLDGAGGAQVLVRKLPAPFKSLAYVPRGPVVDGAAASAPAGVQAPELGRAASPRPPLEQVDGAAASAPAGVQAPAPGRAASPRPPLEQVTHVQAPAPGRAASLKAPLEQVTPSHKTPLEQITPSQKPPLEQVTPSPQLLDALCAWAKDQGCIELKIEPHWPAGAALPAGFRRSSNDVLIARTVILDLAEGSDALLAAAAKKTRQYIRKSNKDGVTVRESAAAADIEQALDIYRQTAERAGFGIHVPKYYQDIAKELKSASRLFVAEYEHAIVAFLWLAVTPALAFELYGGVSEAGQAVRANYALKWQAITQLAAEGVALYDMNGLLNDGVSNFKLGFSGNREDALVGTLDAPLSPLAGLWENALPKAKAILKRFGR